jgi:hypothetical protein
VRIARQVTDRGVARGVCSHYATAMRTLFYALKRATGAPTDAFVVEVVGEAFGPQDNMHAWNWLIDVERASIAAFDATQIRGQRRKLSIDLKRYHNISAFLATAVRQAATSHGLDPRKVAELLAASVDPETDRGQALLFGIADHSGMNLGLRNRLAEHLASRNFERLLPDWRERLARRTALLGPLGRWVFQGSAGDTLPLPLARLRLPKAQQGLHPDPITGADPRPVKLVWRDRTWELTTSGAHSAVLAEWCSPTSSARSSRRDETPSF